MALLCLRALGAVFFVGAFAAAFDLPVARLTDFVLVFWAAPARGAFVRDLGCALDFTGDLTDFVAFRVRVAFGVAVDLAFPFVTVFRADADLLFVTPFAFGLAFALVVGFVRERAVPLALAVDRPFAFPAVLALVAIKHLLT